MGRRKGSINKEAKVPDVVELDTESKITMLAELLFEIAIQDVQDAAQ